MIDIVAGLSLAAWSYLFFLRDRFWHGSERLPHDTPSLEAWPSVVAIVPARNEALTIGACVTSLMTQNYAGDFSIIVVDDASTDGTSDIVEDVISQMHDATGEKSGPHHASNALHHAEHMAAPQLLEGWTGKLSALNAGLTKAQARSNPPEFIWFTDADVVHPPETLSKLTAKAAQNRLDLVSLMVRLNCESFWERRVIPAFIYFFQMLYPFPAVNDPRAKTAAAAGGCVLLRRESLIKSGGLDAVSRELIDDCAVAGLIKRAGGRLWLGLSDGSKSLRTAETLAPLWSMVQRTAYTQLKYSPWLLIFTVAAMSLIFLAPPVLVLTYPIHNSGFASLIGLSTWIAMAVTYGPTLRDYGQNRWESLILPIIAAFYAAMTVDSAVAHGRHRGGLWKGRHYGPSAETQNLSEFP